jgi:hypothetical protein
MMYTTPTPIPEVTIFNPVKVTVLTLLSEGGAGFLSSDKIS